MSNRFLSYGGSNLTDGSGNIFVNDVKINSLTANKALKSDFTGTLISSNLDIVDVNNLQDELDELGGVWTRGGTKIVPENVNDTLGINTIQSENAVDDIVFENTIDAQDGISTTSITATTIINSELQDATTHITSDGTDHANVVLNDTHRSSDGTNHSYINQDITTTADVTFNSVDVGNLIVPDVFTDTVFPTGFINNTAQISTWSDVNRRWTISPTAGIYSYYSDTIKYTKSGSFSVDITNVEGGHVIYFDGSTLTAEVSSTADMRDIIINKCIVGFVYWDVSASAKIYWSKNSEYHGCSMSSITHYYLHNTVGANYVSGMAVGNIIADADGSLDSHVQYSVASGIFFDEDLTVNTASVISTSGLPIYNRVGSDWEKTINAGFSVRTTGTGRLAWDDGGTLTECTNGDFVLYHIIGINDGDSGYFSIVGQNVYLTRGTARDGALIEMNNLILYSGFAPETVPVATIIYQTRDSYSNTNKCRIRTTEDGDNYIDWRSTSLRNGVTASNHGNLSGLDQDDHTHYYNDIRMADGTLPALQIGATTEVDGILDEDNMVSDSNTSLVTQQSVKAYVDNHSSASIWDRTGTDISPQTSGDALNIDVIKPDTNTFIELGANTSGNVSVHLDRDSVSDNNLFTFKTATASKWYLGEWATSDFMLYNVNAGTTSLSVDASNITTFSDEIQAKTGIVIGSTTNLSIGKLSIHGTAGSYTGGAGQHFYHSNQLTRPTISMLAFNTDDQYFLMDAFLSSTGTWVSSNVTGNAMIQKHDTKLLFKYDNGIAPGGTVGWNTGFNMSTTNGRLTSLATYLAPVSGVPVYVSSSGSLGYPSSLLPHKMDIVDVTDTSNLYRLNVIQYHRRETDQDGNHTNIPVPELSYGYIAEEVKLIDNSLCFYNRYDTLKENDSIPDGAITHPFNDRMILKDVPELMGVKMKDIGALAVKCIQELKILVDAQQTTINLLQNRLTLLEAKDVVLSDRITALEEII